MLRSGRKILPGVPTKDSIPREITRNISCGIAFSVGDHIANDGLLGSGKFRAGIRATDLRMKTDRGTCVAVGLTDATFELINTFYVPYEDGIDQVSPVVARAMAEITQLRRTGPAPDPATEEVNHPGSDGGSVLSGGLRDGPIFEAPS